MLIQLKTVIPLIFFVIFLVISFFIIKPILLSIFLGGLLAYLFYPVTAFIQSKMNNKVIPPLLVSVTVLLLLAIFGTILLKAMVEQSYTLFITGKQRITAGLFENCTNQFCMAIKGVITNLDLKFQLQDTLRAFTNWIVRRGSAIIIGLPKFVLSVFIVFFTMFYFLKDGSEFSQKMGKFLSIKDSKYLFIMKRLKEIIYGLIFGNILVAIIQGTLGAVGFLIFGIPSPVFWGFMMSLLALVPSLGTGIVWFPASLILFLNGLFQNDNGLMIKGILLFVYSAILVSGIDNILKPKLVGAKAKIHPAIIFVGIFGGFLFFGAWGIILGPLILSLTTVLIECFIVEKN